MKGIAPYASPAAAILLSLALAGCATSSTTRLDPFAIDGPTGGGPPMSYEAMMRIGDAARQGGDFANALRIYRRAEEVSQSRAAPFAAAGDALRDMGSVNEAIVSYNAALSRDPHNRDALLGEAKAYLETGRPELAYHPLSVALMGSPNDIEALLLTGVTCDLTGDHVAAQARYRHGLKIAPGHPGLSLDLALSLALTGKYPAAIGVLQPVAMAPHATPRERQTLALIYGLAGNKPEAARLGRIDLDEAAVEHNLAYYDTLRAMPPAARARAIQPTATVRQAAARQASTTGVR